MLERMERLGAHRIALMGGVAVPTRRYLPSSFQELLVEPEGDALAGALQLAS